MDNKDLSHKAKSLEVRQAESRNVNLKYPDKICAYVEKSMTCKDIDEIDKHKFLVPNTLTIAEFIFIIRKRLHVPPEKGLFFFVNNHIISGNISMSDISIKHKAPDGFLYITYSAENCFGTGIENPSTLTAL